MKTKVGSCPKCGAPIYASTACWSVTPPPNEYTCGCVRADMGIASAASTTAGTKVNTGERNAGTTPIKSVEEHLDRWLHDEAVLTKVEMLRILELYDQEILKAVVEGLQTVFEKYVDKGDERYGWVKHNNTLLQRIEDDAITLVTEILGKK